MLLPILRARGDSAHLALAWQRAVVAVLLSSAPAVAVAAPSCDRPPSLADVLERVDASPRVAASASDSEAQRELVRQAGARPNPDLRLELEDFTGSGEFADFDRSQTTLSFAQRIELGGVRDRRIEAAERQGDAADARGASERAQARAAAKQRYVDLAAAAEELAAARSDEQLARTLVADVERRSASAVASQADVERTRVAAAKSSLDVESKRRNVEVAAARLAASWAGSSEEADCYAGAALAGTLTVPAPPRDGAASPSPATAPAVALAEAEVETMRAEVALARASASPDLEVGAGLRYFAYSDVSAVAEVRVELPFFDRNEGAIAAAERRLAAAQSRALAVRSETEARARRLRETMAAAAARVRAIETHMLPAAEAASSALARAWQSGAASTFETIDARRTLVELRQQRIEATAEYWRARTSLEALTGDVPPTLQASTHGKETPR